MNITMIGLGKLGLPCAEEMAKHGHRVHAYDIKKKQTKNVFQFPNIAGAVASSDYVFVAVPTPHVNEYDGAQPTSNLEPKDFDYTIVENVLQECNKYMNKEQELVLISTVLPGTCRKLAKLVTNTNFVYNPYLIAMGTVKQDLVNPEMIIIGGNSTLKEFYNTFTKRTRYVEGTYEEAECVKVFYNTFISAKISLVNMMQDVAQKLGNVNVDVVTDALAKSTKRISSGAYMKAGMGDGGACHPRDNIALRKLSKDLNLGYDIFGAVMDSREKQAENMAIEILKYGNKIKFSSDSYKQGVEMNDGSYSLLVQHFIKKHGGWLVDNPSVYVLVHPTDTPMEGVINFDPWRVQTGKDVVRYGDTSSS
jgi:UDPglucose 6-dehydrogenase